MTSYSHEVAMQTVDEDGQKVPRDERVWCYVYHVAGDLSFLCQKGFIAEGCTLGKNTRKSVKVGGITCPQCLKIINNMKEVRL